MNCKLGLHHKLIPYDRPLGTGRKHAEGEGKRQGQAVPQEQFWGPSDSRWSLNLCADPTETVADVQNGTQRDTQSLPSPAQQLQGQVVPAAWGGNELSKGTSVWPEPQGILGKPALTDSGLCQALLLAPGQLLMACEMEQPVSETLRPRGVLGGHSG